MAKPKTKPKTKTDTKRGAKASRSSFRGKTKAKAKAKPKPKAKPATKNPVATQAATTELLGEITVPSGKLAIFDVGLVGYLPREALQPALVIAEVPATRALSVVGQRVSKGRFSDCWDHVAIPLGVGEVVATKKLGEAGVDFARLVCMDLAALDHWQHEDSLDGKADFVFWGRDAGQLAKAMRAPASAEGHGWVDLPVAEAEAKADRAAKLKADNHWLLAMDLRPHSHHFHALAAARASDQGAGVIEVGGAKVCLFFTSWGDGVFPIFLDSDGAGRPVRIRIQLATADSNAAMRAVNR